MANGIQKVCFILPQGKPQSKALYNPSGFLLVGMASSLGKTFRTYGAALEYAMHNGFTVVSRS